MREGSEAAISDEDVARCHFGMHGGGMGHVVSA
jgi:hypothetical protein